MAQSHSRTYRGAWRQVALISVVVSAVLAARNLPPNFPTKTSVHASLSASWHHDQRPRFDHHGSYWSSPTDSFLLAPPAAECANVGPASESFSTLQKKGFHYNRPPPLI